MNWWKCSKSTTYLAINIHQNNHTSCHPFISRENHHVTFMQSGRNDIQLRQPQKIQWTGGSVRGGVEPGTSQRRISTLIEDPDIADKEEIEISRSQAQESYLSIVLSICS